MKLTTHLTRFAQLETILAAILVLTPLFLRIADTDARDFKSSISAYIEIENRHIFGMFITAAALLFIYNGVLNIKKKKYVKEVKIMCESGDMPLDALAEAQKEQPPGKRYNILLGISLLGVLLFNYKGSHGLGLFHYISAGVFFVGSIIVMVYVSNAKYKKTGYCLAAISAASLALYFVIPETLTLFWSEWIALTAIAIHYVLEANYKGGAGESV